jgi:hypothetical protein
MRRIFTLLSILVLSFSMISCGKNMKNLVTDIGVETLDDGTSQYVSTDFVLDIGGTELPFISYPLPNDLGALRLYRLNGQNKIAIDLNLTSVLKLPRVVGTLPNGQAIPVDTNGAGIISIDIEGINSKVYVAQREDTTLVGFAIAIKQLDGLGDSIGSAGIFPSFELGNIRLTAGVFTSKESKETGIAAFANLGQLFGGNGMNAEISSNKELFKPVRQRRLSRKQQRRAYSAIVTLLNSQEELIISEK